MCRQCVKNVREGDLKRHFSGERKMLKLILLLITSVIYITYHDVYLAMLTGKSCVLLNSVQRMTVGCFWSFSNVYTLN